MENFENQHNYALHIFPLAMGIKMLLNC